MYYSKICLAFLPFAYAKKSKWQCILQRKLREGKYYCTSLGAENWCWNMVVNFKTNIVTNSNKLANSQYVSQNKGLLITSVSDDNTDLQYRQYCRYFYFTFYLCRFQLRF